MATDTIVKTAAPPVAGEQRVLTPRISWDAYVAFGEELARQGGRSVRLTYDRGSLEILTTGAPHERHKTMLAKLVEMYVYKRDIEACSGGQMTFRQKDLQRSLEPDECWWIAHERQMRSREEYDPHDDPPPDLALEVEISCPLLDQLSVYAALRVPEIWRFTGRQLGIWQRQNDDSCRQVESSVSFPSVRPEQLLPYLRVDDEAGETSRLRQFAEWLREEHFD